MTDKMLNTLVSFVGMTGAPQRFAHACGMIAQIPIRATFLLVRR